MLGEDAAGRSIIDRLRLEAIENAHDYANSLMAHKRKDKELSELRQKLESMHANIKSLENIIRAMDSAKYTD